MKIKNLCYIVLGGLSLVGLCACGNQNSNQNSSNNNSSTNTTSQTSNENSSSAVMKHTPDAIKNRGELIVGVKSGGFEFFKDKDGKDAGYEVELANAIAKDIGDEVKVKFVESEVDPMLESLEKGDIDIALASLESTDELKSKYTLSTSYWPWEQNSSSMFILKSNKEKYNSLNDFSTSKMAAVKDSIQENVIEHYAPNATLVSCSSIDECIEKLKSGEADVLVADDTDIGDSLKNNEEIINSDIVIPESSEDQGLFIAMMKNNTELQKKINETITKHRENGDIENWIIEAYSQIISMGIPGYDENTASTEE